MKIDKGQITSLILVLIVILLFFTPVGTKLKAMIDLHTLPAPQFKSVADVKLIQSEDWQVQLKAYNGFQDIQLEEFKGEVLFINFWGTWCGPCVAEMPSLQKLYDAKGENVKFAFIAIGDKPEKINSFLKKTGYTMPIYEPNLKFSKEIHPLTFPTTYVLNKKGEIVFMERGAVNWDAPEIHRLLDKLIAESD